MTRPKFCVIDGHCRAYTTALAQCFDLKTERDTLLSEVSDLKGIQKKYLDLIYEVAQKCPGETRHETAKRYIRERENRPHCEGSDTVSDTRG